MTIDSFWHRAGVVVSCSCAYTNVTLAAPLVAGNWTQSWGDDFDAGTADLAPFTYETGNNGGWGNNEQEVYTNGSNNVSVSGGNLHLTAVATANKTYTSGRIKTSAAFSQSYGLFEFRAKMPTGQGLWPAIWMMPKDSAYGVWPNSGEVDIAEGKGEDATWMQGSLHSGTAYNTVDTQNQTLKDSGAMPAGFSTADFHTYDLEWTKGTANRAGSFKWYVDGVLYETQQGGWVVPSGATSRDAPFDKPFYLIFNLAVGGNYVSNPSLAAGAYDMQIDYARAYVTPEPASLTAAAAAGTLLLRRRRGANRLP